MKPLAIVALFGVLIFVLIVAFFVAPYPKMVIAGIGVFGCIVFLLIILPMWADFTS